MFCKNCGVALTENATVCPSCGASQATACANPAPVVTNIIPEENRPLSAWAYFGLQLLFAIPVVGFVFLIVFSCNGSNINRRNFARSYWCGLIIVLIAVAVLFVCALALGSLDSIARYLS